MRLFVGIPLPERLRGKVKKLQKELKDAGADLKLVSPENLHFTVKFLGNVNEDKIDEIASRLKDIAEKHSSLDIELNGTGVFPNRDYIKVVWVGIKENPELLKLTREVQDRLEYIRKERHETTLPHLTVARVKSAKGKKKILDVLDKYDEEDFGSFTIDSFILYKSELTPEGPVYEDVEEFNF